jgi:RimJ/RimL family protein N-acetyltransferase
LPEERITTMSKDPGAGFFPMTLSAGVVGRLVDVETAQRAREVIGPQIFAPREEYGQFVVPEARRKTVDHLQEQYVDAGAKWIVFYNGQGEPVGWCYGYMEDSETFFIDTVGLVLAYRGRGIYTAFLPRLIAYLGSLGYERLTTSHHPNNRAVMIPELKAGFHIVGLELHEGCGALIKMAYLFHDDRREGFRRAFSLAP